MDGALDFQEGNIDDLELDDTLSQRFKEKTGEQRSLLLGIGHHLQRLDKEI